MSIIDSITGGLGGVAQMAEQAAGTLIGGPAGSLVGPLMSGLLQGPGQSALGQLPQIFGNLFQSVNPGQNSPFQASPLPFSQAASGLSSSLFNSPSQLMNSLGSATQKVSSGLGGLDTSSLGGGLDAQMAQAQSEASSGSLEGALQSMQDMMAVQTQFSSISNLISTIGKLQEKAIDNSKVV